MRSSPGPRPGQAAPRARAIIQAVAEQVECTADDVLSDTKHPRITFARALAMLAVQRFYVPRLSTVELGLMFDRDHSTIISALKRARRIAEEPANAGVFDAAMTAAFEAWTSATPWAPKAAEPPPPVPGPVASSATRGHLTAALVAPVLARSASLAEAAKELGCTTAALNHLRMREPELQSAYEACARRGKKGHAAHRRSIASIWTRGNVKLGEAAE